VKRTETIQKAILGEGNRRKERKGMDFATPNMPPGWEEKRELF